MIESIMFSEDRMKRAAAAVSVLLHRLLGDRHRGRLGVLVHHRISPVRAELPEPPYNVPPATFRDQLVGLRAAGFRFVSMSAVLEASRNGQRLPPRSVLLTFDDAYESVYHYAFPVMRELGLPGVAFLSTAYLDSEEPFQFDDWAHQHRASLSPEEYRPIRIEQCREMLDSGLFEFGAHTHTHADFRGRPDDCRRDVAVSAQIIRDLFQCRDVAFAFPWGLTSTGVADGQLAAAARDAGVACGMTTAGELIDLARNDCFHWGRFIVFPWDTPETLAAKLAGWYAWAHHGKLLLRRPSRPTTGDRLPASAAPVTS